MGDFLDDIKEEYGEEVVGETPDVRDIIPTGSVSLDISTDIGGVPVGRFTHIYGPDSSGKTTLAIEICGNAISKGGKALYIDLEQTLDSELVKNIFSKYDIDTQSYEENFIALMPEIAEDAFRIIERALAEKEFSVIVFDSVGAMLPEKEMEDDFGDAHYALAARLLTTFFRRNAQKVRTSNVAFVFLNQVRANIGSFIDTFEMPGGYALKHYTSLGIMLFKSTTIEPKLEKNGKKKKTKIGNKVKFIVQKNKVGIPFRSSYFPIIWGEGIDKERDVLDFANEIGIVSSKGPYKAYDGDTIGLGTERSVQAIKEDKELLDKLIKECYNAIGVEIGVDQDEETDNEDVE